MMVTKIQAFPWGVQRMTWETVMETTFTMYCGKSNDEVMFQAL